MHQERRRRLCLLWQEPCVMLSVYVTLGVLLLLAARNPTANRSLVAFTAWSSFVHSVVMGALAYVM